MLPLCLVIPPSPFLLDERVFPSLGVLKIAAVLEKAGVPVSVLDLSGVSNYMDVVAHHAKTSGVTQYGITLTTPQAPAAFLIARRLKRILPESRLLAGGPHPTVVSAASKLGVARAILAMNQLHSVFDVVVAGDGEKSIFEALEGRSRLIDADDAKSPLFLSSADLEAMPLPARHLVDLDSYHYTIDGVKATSLIAQLGCPYGCHFCLTGDTTVFTKNGPVPLSSLIVDSGKVVTCAHGGSIVEHVIGVEVATPKGHALATRVFENGVRSVFRIDVEGGHSIKSTTDHRFMVAENSQLVWREAKDLTPGDFLAVRRPEFEWATENVPLDAPGWYYVEVLGVTPAGEEPVYDLTVPGENAFIANGFVAHNCCGRDSAMLRRIRTRNTQSITNELIHLHKAYGFSGFMFYDDELNVNKQLPQLMREVRKTADSLGTEFRLRGFVKSELFTEEQAEVMYAAGFRWILIGFESGSERILKNMNKKATVEDNTRCMEIAKKHGLKVKALMSIGHPGESERTIEMTKDWLIKVKPDDFDATVITTYPGSPYYDKAVVTTSGGHSVWTYTCPDSGDRLHSEDVDYSQVSDYYKGDPDGGYVSHVFTDYLTPTDISRLRNEVERDVRKALNIPFNPGHAAIKFEHSMGQGIPGSIYRIA